VPVLVALAGDVWALVAASHRDDDVGLLGQLAREVLGLAIHEIDAELAHHLDDLRMNAVTRRRPRRQRRMAVAGGSLEKSLAHLRATGVMKTHEQDRCHGESCRPDRAP